MYIAKKMCSIQYLHSLDWIFSSQAFMEVFVRI